MDAVSLSVRGPNGLVEPPKKVTVLVEYHNGETLTIETTDTFKEASFQGWQEDRNYFLRPRTVIEPPRPWSLALHLTGVREWRVSVPPVVRAASGE